MSRLAELRQKISPLPGDTYRGHITAIKGPVVYATLPHIGLNDECTITTRNGRVLKAQAIGFHGSAATLAPYDDIDGISPGDAVTHRGKACVISFPSQTGVILNAQGDLLSPSQRDLPIIERQRNSAAPDPLSRIPIQERLHTGVSAIDLFCPIGYGQRIGLFAAPGLGKSTLLGMMAKNAAVDLCVIALVGERGREVGEFVHECLGQEGLARSIVVTSTSDESPLRRTLAIHTATSIAEHYRDQGKRVLLLVDSMTRVARALRDVSLTAGELPIRHGYTSSVYTELPKLIERTGNNQTGSITAIYTVLTSGPEELDPLTEELKGLLDGHIILNQQTLEKGILPAIDVTRSLSRLYQKLTPKDQGIIIAQAKKVLTRIYNDKELTLLGGEPDEELKRALALEDDLYALLSQRPKEKRELLSSISLLKQLLGSGTQKNITSLSVSS